MDRLHITGLPAQVHRDHDLGQASFALGLLQLARKGLRAEVVGARVDIDEVDLRTAVQTAVGRGDEGDRAGPQAIARTES
ncbi:hypothetical protein D3C84_1161430 [compost metagenome]